METGELIMRSMCTDDVGMIYEGSRDTEDWSKTKIK